MADHGFWTYAQKDPSKLALVEPNGREWTRGELVASCNRIVHGLRALGLGKGDVVAAVLPNDAAIIELYLAVAQAGMYLVPVNWHLTAPEIAYIVQDSEAKVLVADERFGDACKKAAAEVDFPAERRFAVGKIDGFRPFAELSAGQPDTTPDDRAAGAVMNYTSGTTGRPKGVRRKLPPIDPDIAATLMTGFFAMFGIKPEDGNVHLCGSPLYHTAVLVFSSTSLHYGHAVVLMERWTPEMCLEAIQKYRVTTSHMVPTQFHRLLALPEDVRKRYDVTSTRCMVHAAAPCPVDVKKRMIEWWGPAICEYYAATEGGGTLVGADEWMTKRGTVGRPWAGAEIRIYDDAGNPLPPGQIGTVYMKLGAADFEYYKDKDKTRKNRIENFFTVGDVGLLDEDGYLFLRDRKADMIISGGVNIYPAEIENEFLSHPKVGDVAVFGIPHEEWGEEVRAVIEPATGVEPGPELERELLEWAKDRIAKYKTPKTIDFIAEMPRDPNGKLYKRKLRDPFWEGRERSI
jgi:long-chain acyl-CoA synthetase